MSGSSAGWVQKGPGQRRQRRHTAGLWHPSLEEPLPKRRQCRALPRAYPSCSVLRAPLCVFAVC